MGCGSSKTTTQQASTTTAPPPQYSQAYSDLQTKAAQTADQPLQQYQGNIVAPFSDQQNAAFGNIDALQGAAQPYLTAAGTDLANANSSLWNGVQQYSPGAAAQYTPGIVQQPGSLQSYMPQVEQWSPGAAAKYMSPYTQDVVNATQNQFANSNAQQFNQANGSAAAAGAFGGDRSASLAAQLGGQQAAAQSPVIAGLYNTGYQNAQSEFNQQQQVGLQSSQLAASTLAQQQGLALQQWQQGQNQFNTQQQVGLGANEAQAQLAAQSGFGNMQLAQESTQLPLAASQAQLQAGTMQQQQAQTQLNVPYEQYLQQQAYPFQTESWLSGIDTGLGSLAGGTSSTSGSQTTPGASPFSQLLGLGMTAASFIKDGGPVKDNVVPFRKRAGGGGMVPYQPISLSSDVPDLSTSFIPASQAPSGGKGPPAAPNISMSSAPAQKDDSGNSAIGQGIGMLSKSFGPSADGINPVAITPNQLTGEGGSGGIFGTGESNIGSAIGDLGSNALKWLGAFFADGGQVAPRKKGGMIPLHRADGGADDQDDDIEPVTMTPQAVSNYQLHTNGPDGGFAPVTPAAVTPQGPDWRQALLAAGLGTLAGGSHSALQNIGAGGLQGLANWNAQKTANTNEAEKEATIQNENNRVTISQQEAQARAAQLADTLDETKVNRINAQANADRGFYQQVKNQNAERKQAADSLAAQQHYQQQELGMRQKEIDASQAGSWTYQGTDPVSGDIMEINSKTGIPRTVPAQIGAKPSSGGASGVGGREAVFTNRVINAGNAAAQSVDNLMELPTATTSGIFGGRHQGSSIMDALGADLANTLTSEDAKSYNTMFTGVTRNLATLESAGLAPGSLVGSMDNLRAQEGDSNFIRLRKAAEMRQIVDTNLSPTLSNPRVPDEQKALVKKILGQIDAAVPFTQHDLTVWSKNPNQSLRDFSAQQGLGRQSPPPEAIAHLKADKSLRGAFDQKYGAGSAEAVLGQ